MKQRNPVARFMRAVNKSATMVDRKAAAKRGYSKHQGRKSWSTFA